MRQKRLLFILLAILALSTIYALWATPRSGTKDEEARVDASAAPPRGERQVPVAERQRLRVELLQPETREYPGFTRDIFAPLYEPPKVVRRPPPPKNIVEPVAPEPPGPPPMSQEQVSESLANFTFLGFLDKGDERTIFLASGGDVFLVQQGDRFGENDRFTVLNITREELSIRQGEDPRLITIPLLEKEPLIPSF